MGLLMTQLLNHWPVKVSIISFDCFVPTPDIPVTIAAAGPSKTPPNAALFKTDFCFSTILSSVICSILEKLALSIFVKNMGIKALYNYF